MYHIQFFENGHYVTNIGGAIQTLAQAVEQIARLCESEDTEELDTYVGCKWTRGRDIVCVLIVANELGIPIKNI